MKLHRLLIHQIFFISVLTMAGSAVAQSNQPSRYPDRIILNLTEESANSIAVTWRTDTTVKTGIVELQYAAAMILPDKSVTFDAVTSTMKYIWDEEPEIISNHHSAIITGLSSGEKYVYRVGSPGFWSEWFDFKTPSTDPSRFSFIYFGDPQNDLKSQWSRVIRNAYRHQPDCAFMLYGGDLINRAGKDIEWHEWFEAGSFIYSIIPQIMTPGNHDYDGLTLSTHWNSQFTLPDNSPPGLEGTCFFIDYKNLRLIAIDTATGRKLRNENSNEMIAQKLWLESVLSTNTKEWVILTTHLPFYSPKENRDNHHIHSFANSRMTL